MTPTITRAGLLDLNVQVTFNATVFVSHTTPNQLLAFQPSGR
jgi:hypothetical protein